MFSYPVNHECLIRVMKSQGLFHCLCHIKLKEDGGKMKLNVQQEHLNVQVWVCEVKAVNTLPSWQQQAIYHCIVSSHDLHQWLKPSSLRSFWAPLLLIDPQFLLTETVFALKICSLCRLLALSWHNVYKAELTFLFFFFFKSQNRPDNDTVTELLDKRTQPWGQSVQ